MAAELECQYSPKAQFLGLAQTYIGSINVQMAGSDSPCPNKQFLMNGMKS